MSLAQQVSTNLTHYNLWKSVEIHESQLCSGFPASKLDLEDPDDLKEWVIPKLMNDKDISSIEIESWFSKITSISSKRPKRITIALINDDATIVYYFVHDGIVKPRQN